MSNTLEPIFAPYIIEGARFISTTPDMTVSSKTATGVLGKMLEEYKNGQQAIDEIISYHLNALAEVYFKAMEEFDSTRERREIKCNELYDMMDITVRNKLSPTRIPWGTIYIVGPNHGHILDSECVDLVAFPFFRTNGLNFYNTVDAGSFQVIVKFDCGGYKFLHNKYELIVLNLLLKRNAVYLGDEVSFHTLRTGLSLDEYNELMMENFPEIAELSEKYIPDFFNHLDTIYNVSQKRIRDIQTINEPYSISLYPLDCNDGCQLHRHRCIRHLYSSDRHEIDFSYMGRPMDAIMFNTKDGSAITDNISKYMYLLVLTLLNFRGMSCHDKCREIADYIEERYRENK